MEIRSLHQAWLEVPKGRRLWKIGPFSLDPGISLFLTLGISLVIVLLMTATTIIDVRDRREDIRRSMRQTGQDFAAIANGVLPDALNDRDLRQLGQFAAALWAQRDTSYVKIFDREGALLVGPGEDQFPRGVIDKSVLQQVTNLQPIFRRANDGLEVVAPVNSGAQLVGAVQFGFDEARIRDEIDALTMARIYQTLFLVCLGFGGSVIVSSYFMRPVQLLVRATRRISEGDLSTRVERLRGKEMRNLGSSFNSMADELQRMVEALQGSRERIASGEERVRRELASHLHGPVQGRLLALRAQLDQVQRNEELPPDSAADLRGIIDEMGRVIQSEIAVLSHRLYPAIIRRGLVPALQSLCDEFESTLKLQLKVPPELVAAERMNSGLLPERTRLTAYRICNEALTNIVKHARHSEVTVSVTTSPSGWLELIVNDDGPGFDTSHQGDGLGLAAMRDYAEAGGGACSILSRPGGGTTVGVRLPAVQS